MPIKAIEPRRLYRQVADQLRDLIDAGEYTIGERLPGERELADRFGVSRPTIREALIALEVEGKVRIRVGSGIYVYDTPQADLVALKRPVEGPFELLRAREFIEGAIAEEAARKVTSDDIEAMDAVLEVMERQSHPSRRTLGLDRAFHEAVAGVLGNEVLVRYVGELFDERVNPYFERLSSYFEDHATWVAAMAEHRAVRDAIASGDPATAKFAMQRHLRLSQVRFSRSFGEMPAPVPEVEELATVARE